MGHLAHFNPAPANLGGLLPPGVNLEGKEGLYLSALLPFSRAGSPNGKSTLMGL